MSPDERSQRSRQGMASPPRAALPSYEDDAGGWSSGEVLRLLVSPALVTVLFFGGVYWIRMQMPAGSMGQQPASVVQVQLLPRPDPAQIAVASASQSATQAMVGRAETSPPEPDPLISDEPAPVPRAKAFSPADMPPSNILSPPSVVSGPASSAAAKFQQALLRHVSHFQRHPSVARPGMVDTLFSMGRDGRLLGVWVRTSSGQLMLDNEAIETIRRAQPLPPIPPELPDPLTIDVQLAFDPP